MVEAAQETADEEQDGSDAGDAGSIGTYSDELEDDEHLALDSVLAAQDREFEAYRLRRAVRDLEESASQYSDGYTNWRDVTPQVREDLERAQRRLRDYEAVGGDIEGYDADRLRRRLRDIELDLDQMESDSRWSDYTPSIQDNAWQAHRSAKELEWDP